MMLEQSLRDDQEVAAMKYSRADLLVSPLILALFLSVSSCAPLTVTLNNRTSSQEKVAPPTFDIAEGSFNVDQQVGISCATSGSTIYYTTDGSTPTASSNAYSSSISVSGASVHTSSAIAVSGDDASLTIKAIAVKNDMINSDVANATYNINYLQLAAPTFTPASGSFSIDTDVTINSPAGADIHYTTDGSEPTAASTLYTAPVTVSGNGTDTIIKAIAIQDQKLDSPVTSEEYIINYNKVSTPQVSPAAGTYENDQSVAITCNTDGAAIYYTTDESTPTASSTLYTGAISVSTDETIKAIALKNMAINSDVISAAYVLQVATPLISPSSGGVGIGTAVTITTTTTGATIRYTTNGATPDGSSTLYDPGNKPTIILAETFEAKVFKAGYADSDTATASYTIVPVVSHFAGTLGGKGSDNGTGLAASFNSPQNLTSDGTNLYVADSGSNTIRKVVIATGVVTIFAGSTTRSSGSTDGIGTAARFYTPNDITNDGANLYVSDNNNHTIRKIVISTAEVSTLAGAAGSYGSTNGTGAAARFRNPYGITNDGTNLYVADYTNNTIRKIVIGTAEVTTLAGTAGSRGSANGTGAVARFYSPQCITSDGTNLYVTDSYNYTVRKIVIATAEVTTLAGTAGSHASTDGTGAAARFYTPAGITNDGTNLYVADNNNYAVRKIVIATAEVTTLAGTADSYGSTDDTGAAARFRNPQGITIDGTNLYMADTGNSTIRKIVIATAEVTTLAGTAGSTGSTNGIGSDARFNYPYSMASDGTNLYVVDASNQTIRKVIIATAEVTTFAGTTGSSGSTNGTGTAAKFNNPRGITSDGTNLYVVESSGQTVRKIVIATAEVTTLAGTAGVSGSANGIGAAARFKYPQAITNDGTNLYVADSSNYTIRKIVIATAVVTTLAGTVGSSGSADGVGTAAKFNNPYGMSTDGTNLYVADFSNYTIRKIVIATATVTTFAGTAGSSGTTDSTGVAARFNTISDITTDGTNLYVTDSGNNLLRKIVIATAEVTTLAGVVGYFGHTDGILSSATFYGPYGIVYIAGKLYISENGNNDIRKLF